ncbi:MAG: peptidase M22 [Opitutaceae bacterium]
MASLRELHAAHGSVLTIDAASSRVQVGHLRSDGRGEWQSSDEEAGVAVFQCFEKLRLAVGDVGAFAFCDGPGSILGIRTVAMALRTWQLFAARPIFSYCSLALVAHALGRPELAAIADARRESWHHYRIGGPLRRLATSELEGELVMPDYFRHWSELPPHVTRVPYVVSDLLPRVIDTDLFQATEAPDAFLHSPPNYLTWTPQIHRAPSPR